MARQSSYQQRMVHQTKLVMSQLFGGDIIVTGFDVLEQGLNRPKTSCTESALGTISDDMILGMQGQFLSSLEGQTTLGTSAMYETIKVQKQLYQSGVAILLTFIPKLTHTLRPGN